MSRIKMTAIPPPHVQKEGGLSKAHIKLGCLAALVFQTTSSVMATRYSKGVLKEPYAPGTVILLMESLKLLMCLGVTIAEGHSLATIAKILKTSLPLAVPALTYFIQNIFNFAALQYLPGPIFAIVNQFKIVSTAVLSVVILKKELSLNQWKGSLFLI